MSVVDVGVALFVLLMAWNGYRAGFLLEIAALVRIAVGVVAGARFFSVPSAWLATATGLPLAMTNLAGFVAIFAFAQIVLSLIYAVTVYPAVNLLRAVPGLGGIDRLLGIVPAALQALFWAAFALSAFLLLPISQQAQALITHSTLGNALVVDLSSYQPKVQELLGNTTAALDWAAQSGQTTGEID